jgi:large subunit ribosomal protein L4e
LPNAKSLLSALQNFGVGDDLAKVRKSRHARAGQGKYRNSKYVLKKGPLIIYDDESEAVKRAARNLPGIDTCHVGRLNILQLAPGGHLGRFIIFTTGAFKRLNLIFGTHDKNAVEKAGYSLNRTVMTCADLSRIINSDQVQSKLRALRTSVRSHDKTKKNPLKNKAIMQRLNPFHAKSVAILQKGDADRHAKRAAVVKAKRSKAGRASKHVRTAAYHALQGDLNTAFKAAEDVIAEEEKAGNYMPGDTSEDEE